jgi:cation diffusion facilitator family transporter
MMKGWTAVARSPVDAGDRITLLRIAANIGLLAMKLIVGLLIGSAGLIADALHSGSDMATDLAVLGGMHLARRRPDAHHPYGHGRFETLAGGVVAGSLMVVGLYLSWQGIEALYRGIPSLPGPWLLAVAAISIVAKEWLFRRTAAVARSVGSAALHANAWHHRSDALSSVAVLAGGIGSLAGWGYADPLAAALVGLMVVTAGARTLLQVFHELSEGGLTESELAAIEAALSSVDGAADWHQLRGRRVGRESFLDVHVLVDPGLSVVAGHRIASRVEEAIRTASDRPINVLVHIEPNGSR